MGWILGGILFISYRYLAKAQGEEDYNLWVFEGVLRGIEEASPVL